jgi:PKHD-type hydroxylase
MQSNKACSLPNQQCEANGFSQDVLATVTVPDVLSEEQCLAVKGLAVGRGLYRSEVLGQDLKSTIRSRVRTCESAWIDQSPSTQFLYDAIIRAAVKINDQKYRFDIGGLETVSVLRYRPFQKFDWHWDTYTGSKRKLTCVVNLSSPDEYLGGGLQTKSDWRNAEIRYDLGAASFFPSYIEHRAKAPWLGTRWVAVAWITGEPWK